MDFGTTHADGDGGDGPAAMSLSNGSSSGNCLPAPHAPPQFDSDTYFASVPEHQLQTMGDLLAVNAAFADSYSLSGGGGLFAIDSLAGTISLTDPQAVVYETASSRVLTVTATNA